MKLHTVTSTENSSKSQCLVVFTSQEDGKVLFDSKGCGCEAAAPLITQATSDNRFKAGPKDVLFFRSQAVGEHQHLLVVGLGSRKKIDEETLRISTALAIKTLAKEKIISATFCVQSFRKLFKDAVTAGRAIAEAAILTNYKYEEVKSKKTETKDYQGLVDIYFPILKDKTASGNFNEGILVGTITAESTCFSRNLANAPGNYMTPTILAEQTQKAFKGLPVKVQILNKKQISDLKMGCLLGVNRGSAEEPRFIVLEYNGGKKSDKPLVLVGKGLTFDSGGISIKPSASMEEMKFDMCGGAAVIGACLAIARLKLKLNVVVLVPSTENMPGDAAVKPGDVLVALNGKTVEVNNTDAEGRLILADALAYACEESDPATIVDAATLTGACVIALGNVYSGLFTRDEKLLKKILEASNSSGERVWQLPLSEEFVDDMKGTYADLSNVANAKGGGSSQGAGFLSNFVDPKIPWAHLDVAGTSYNAGGRYPYHPDKGASGHAVRLLVDLAINF